jgi:hypothetical protein
MQKSECRVMNEEKIQLEFFLYFIILYSAFCIFLW